MKLILLTLALAAIAVTHCNANGGLGMPCLAMHGKPASGTLRGSGTLEPAGGDTVGDCNVMLEADSGQRLQITLTSIDMEYTSDQALFDYYRDEYNEDYEAIYLDRPQFQSTDLNITCHQWLEVRDGPAQSSPLLGEYCGNKELLSLPITLQTSEKYAFVRFYKKVRESEAAFQLEYHPVGSDTTCKGPWDRSSCRPGEEFCAYDGIQDKAVVFKCARKVAVGEYCEDDSWCDPSSAECPARHECATKCNNGRCKNIKTRVWKKKHDCCNPNLTHECDPTTWENERGYRESLECNSNMWQCQPSFGYDGEYDEAWLKEICMEELGVTNL